MKKDDRFDITDEMRKKTSPKNIKMLDEVIEKYTKFGIPPYESLKFDRDMLETLYSHAFHLFQSGNFKKAATIFMILNALEPKNFKTLFALAASYHHLKEFEKAAPYYVMCAIIHPKDPLCRYHLFDCFKHLDKAVQALNAIDECIELCKENTSLAKLQQDAAMEALHYREELKKYPEKVKMSLLPPNEE